MDNEIQNTKLDEIVYSHIGMSMTACRDCRNGGYLTNGHIFTPQVMMSIIDDILEAAQINVTCN